MFERFTDQARQVVVFAQDEAGALKHNYIGTEHLLLGLLRVGPTMRVLSALDVTLEEVRAQVARIVGEGEMPTSGQIPFTPRTKKVLELSLLEAQSQGHDSIEPEHILLGLVQEGEGVAMRILEDLDAGLDKIREETMGLLGWSSSAFAEAARRADWPKPQWGPAHRLSYEPRRASSALAFLLGAAVFSAGLLAGWLIWG